METLVWYTSKSVGVYFTEHDLPAEYSSTERSSWKDMDISIPLNWDHHDDLQVTYYALMPDYLNF